MKISKRQKKIIWNILEYENITLEKLSENLLISPKTISKEIFKLNIFFKAYETEINLKDKKGIRINSIYPQEDLINIINMNQQLSSEDEIKLYILLYKKPIKISQLEEKFLISRPTVNKIIKTIQQEYKITKEESKIKINLDNDMKILYSLNLILSYIDTLNYRVTFKNVVEHLDLKWEESWYMIDINTYINSLEDIEYTDQSLVKFYIIKNLMLYLEDESFDILTILKPKNIINLNFKDSLLNEMIDICSIILQDFINISKEDLYPLINHILIVSKNGQQYKQSEIYVYLKYLEEFKAKYPLTLNISQNILTTLNEKLNINLSEYEKYFIALHIQVLFDKNKLSKVKKVLIICEYGVGLSNFLKVRLEQKVNLDLEVSTSSLAKYNFEQEKYQKYHLIVSTILNFKSDYNTVIHVSPFLIDSEILKIQKFLERIESYLVFKTLFKEKDLIYTDSISSKEEAHSFIELLIKPYVEDGYINSLKKRDKNEQIPLNKIIFPHGDPRLVNNNKTLIIILKNSIIWNKKEVSIIIINCWNQKFINNNSQFIKFFYRMLVNDKKILNILDYNKSKEAYRKILNEIKENND